jgi:hypothetical protein
VIIEFVVFKIGPNITQSACFGIILKFVFVILSYKMSYVRNQWRKIWVECSLGSAERGIFLMVIFNKNSLNKSLNSRSKTDSSSEIDS